VGIADLSVDLTAELRGVHMSRFIEAMNAYGNLIQADNIQSLLQSLQERLNSENAFFRLEFPFFIIKSAPVTGLQGPMNYSVTLEAAWIQTELDLKISVSVPVSTLCPCSKAISEYGAHNQRGHVTVQIKTDGTVWIEDLIEIVEKSASCELYSLLKRPDEKAVTEKAYENPVFVEDLVRNVAVDLEQMPEVSGYSVEVENLESIHLHNAFARIRKGI
jgi:GTP cyclohydrolase I